MASGDGPWLTFPTPEAYCYQKGLSFVERADPKKKAKDLYYVYDLLANYPELRARCETEIPKLRASFPPKWYARFLDNLDSHFKTPESEGAVLAGRNHRPVLGTDSERGAPRQLRDSYAYA